ncbi:hypothetical protein [Shewanella subflava]|uniref:Uncharacterized protein n=1 Tax=Shewanella subflava TaxID=2986476 RepID=A0ABT3I5R1_9GAMM|nr:hypothetical protein [Shewanella subflava]MCW3171408.1 hypothetical protein [Shewanella subflava]
MTQLSDNSLIETPEEREAFECLERQLQIDALAAIARTSMTMSCTGIAAKLFDAGCRVDLALVKK